MKLTKDQLASLERLRDQELMARLNGDTTTARLIQLIIDRINEGEDLKGKGKKR